MHKNTKLLPYQRREIFRRWKMGTKVTHLAREYKVTRQTIYDTLLDGKLGIFINRSSMNERYRTLCWGLKRLEKTYRKISQKLVRKAHRLKRYERNVPGELVHLDTKRLPLLRGEAVIQPREYLFVAIDDTVRTWTQTVFAQDTGQPLVVINHGTSEELGMRSLTGLIREEFPMLETLHLPQGCSDKWIQG